MGAACSKSSSHAVDGGVPSSESGGSSSGAGSAKNGAGAGEEQNKGRTFRDRRLSVAQTQEGTAGGNARRLSVYGSAGPGGDPIGLLAPVSSCGCKSIAGLEPVPGGSVSKINQDRAIALYPFNKDKACSLFGVFDGHGRIGEQVSQYVIENLPNVRAAAATTFKSPFSLKDPCLGKSRKESSLYLAHAFACTSGYALTPAPPCIILPSRHPLVQVLERQESLLTDTCTALRHAFIEVDRSLGEHLDASVSGTTAVCTFIRGNHIWLANSGDSRAVLARQKPKSTQLKAIDLTRDHKPDTPDEMKRLLQMGGHVSPAGNNGAPSRVWHNLRGLAMARSIGDHHAATVGVIAEPEVTEYDITDDDVALIIASDGVWELLSSQSVVDIVSSVKSLDPSEICHKIVQESSQMWKSEEGDYRDDITVVVLTFPWLDSYGDEDAAEAPGELQWN